MNTPTKHHIIANRLTFNKDSIELYIHQYDHFKNKSRKYELSASIFLTLLITILSSSLDFMKFSNITEWMFVIATIVTGTVFAIQCWTYHKIKDPIKELKETFYKNYINKPDINALFIIKRKYNDISQILVCRNQSWNCFFLPYIRTSHIENNIEDLAKKKIANVLDYNPEDLIIEKLLEKYQSTEKHHPQENVVKEYHSYYFHLTLSDNNRELIRDITKENNFEIGNKKYEWASLDDLENNEMTMTKNEDVISTIRKNKFDFITHSTNFS